jgi:hypothetical protein
MPSKTFGRKKGSANCIVCNGRCNGPKSYVFSAISRDALIKLLRLKPEKNFSKEQ